MKLWIFFLFLIFIPIIAKAEAETVATKSMSFKDCIAVTENTIASMNVSANRIIPVVNTGILRITKIIADDANILITCSKPDNKMVLTKSTPPDFHLIK